MYILSTIIMVNFEIELSHTLFCKEYLQIKCRMSQEIPP